RRSCRLKHPRQTRRFFFADCFFHLLYFVESLASEDTGDIRRALITFEIDAFSLGFFDGISPCARTHPCLLQWIAPRFRQRFNLTLVLSYVCVLAAVRFGKVPGFKGLHELPLAPSGSLQLLRDLHADVPSLVPPGEVVCAGQRERRGRVIIVTGCRYRAMSRYAGVSTVVGLGQPLGEVPTPSANLSTNVLELH